MNRIRALFLRFLSCAGGVAGIEFAVLAPLFMVMMLAMVQFGALSLGRLSFERALDASMTVGTSLDKAGESTAATPAAVVAAFQASSSSPTAPNFRLIVRRVQIVAGTATEVWVASAGSLPMNDDHAVVSGAVPLPAGTTLLEGESLYTGQSCRRFGWSYLSSASTACSTRWIFRTPP